MATVDTPASLLDCTVHYYNLEARFSTLFVLLILVRRPLPGRCDIADVIVHSFQSSGSFLQFQLCRSVS